MNTYMPLIDNLGSCIESERKNAGKLLLEASTSIEFLLNGLEHRSPKVRYACLWALYKRKYSKIEACFLIALTDEEPKIKLIALDYFKRLFKVIIRSALEVYDTQNNPDLSNLKRSEIKARAVKPQVKTKMYPQRSFRSKTFSAKKTVLTANKMNADRTYPKLAREHNIYSDTSPNRYRPRARKGESEFYDSSGCYGVSQTCKFCYQSFSKTDIGSHQTSCVMNPRS